MSRHIAVISPSGIARIYAVPGRQPAEAIASAYHRTSADIIINAGQFNTLTGATGCALKADGAWIRQTAHVFGLAMTGGKAHIAYFDGSNDDTWTHFVQCYCTLVVGGLINIDTEEKNVLEDRRGRTAVGTKPDGSLVLYVCQDGDDALTGPELAQKMLDLGCTDALNFDGGGSAAYLGYDAWLDTPRALDSFIGIDLTVPDIKTYSNRKDGSRRIAAHFKIGEFACPKTTDDILLSSDLVKVLEDIRALCGDKPMNINSGYRDLRHNTNVGGSPTSRHMKGKAADIRIEGVDTLTVCRAAEKALAARGIPGGLGRYIGQNFVHVDVRAARHRFQQNKAGQAVYAVAGWTRPMLRKGSGGADVKELQALLNERGASPALTVDGSFGPLTEQAVEAFQAVRGLVVDGVCGPKTWAALER